MSFNTTRTHFTTLIPPQQSEPVSDLTKENHSLAHSLSQLQCINLLHVPVPVTCL